MSEDDSVLARQSFTQPPPRYTEATLVKRMEELGIGRPSTYASIVTTIQDREYVRKDKNRLIPEDKGRLVTAFLTNYFPRYRPVRLHRRTGAGARRGLGRRRGLQGGARALLARLLGRHRRDLRASDRRGAGEDQRRPRAAHLPRCGRRDRPAPLPELRQGQALDAHRALGRRLHRLLGISRMPIHPALRSAGRRRTTARPSGRTARCWASTRTRRSPCAPAASAPTCSAATSTDEVPKPPRASIPKGWDGGRYRPGEGAAAAEPAALHRQPSRGRRADRGRHRPLRAICEARPHLREPSEAWPRCSRSGSTAPSI